MVSTLLLVAAIALVAYVAGYLVGRLDERRAHRRARTLSERLAPYLPAAELEVARRPR